MGNFGGHALPGSFFIIFGLWYATQMFNRYFSAKKRNSRFTSTAIFNCQCLCGRLKDKPVEAYVKLFFVSVGFSLEIYTGFSSNWIFVNIGNGQHATMFFFFGVAAAIDILLYYKAPLPPDMDYIAMGMAVMCEYLLFTFHLHGRTDLDVLLHQLLLYAIGGCILSIAFEMRYRNNILCALSRPYFLLLQGSWFWQAGWILYPPFKSSFHWAEDDHNQMMIATMMFAWHAMANLLILLSIGGVVACLHRRFGSYQADDDSVAMKRLIHTGCNGETFVRLHDDSDSEVEFESSTVR